MVAAASLNTRSICNPCDLSHGSALLPGTISAVSEGRNLNDTINAQAAIILVCMAIPPHTHTLICARYSWQRPVSVNKIWMHNDVFEPNHYEPISGRLIGLHISLANEKSCILLN